ncbi:myxovirus resistance 1 [Coprinopsis cinerea okayama7|uniref:Myxovirus resistance 1 n=1 Tax=Coprinopsis cinerea (strain Okayama-7 / 130 / ATCC MYA-4618 / FGSC 9003) TaxID=240176 RepID=A8N530_COPC7|nr:myxovirus resistance 1 [Coprinopsis cinerea okayama7\|eukprot:XP_001829919.2 myxovirus resistance 1 [Coprinopsis cinerea okayama7\
MTASQIQSSGPIESSTTSVQVDIDLPQIAVVGSQSVGKSSLIEAISGITLPRASGTCTSKGQLLGQARNEAFGPTIFDKSEVEHRIRRAQLAILNPNQPPRVVLESDDEEFEDSLTFSNNCVSLKISGPDVADLSFVDLPGMIASGGQPGDKELIESLITSYIKRPSTIVLLAVACETDFENQGAHSIAKLHDPEGKRTIGVLTKPDRIPTGEESSWLPYILGDREVLENNWYCVKQPSSNDLKKNMTWEEARQAEDVFFSTTAPWSELDSCYHRYLRTSNLVEQLSFVLSDLINKRLPQIQEELDKAILKAREALQGLPPPPSSNPFNEVVSMLHRFTDDLKHHVVSGVPQANGLLQAIRPALMKFRKGIKDTAPRFHPCEKKVSSTTTFVQPRFLDNEEGSSEADWTPVAGSGDGVIYVDQVLARAHDARARELPGHVPFVVRRTYIEEIVHQWRRPALELIQTIYALLARYIKDIVNAHFSEFGQGLLEQRVKTIVHNQINECLARAQARVDWLIEVETLPFTLNTHYLSDYKGKFLAFYKATREKHARGHISRHIEEYLNREKDEYSEREGEWGIEKVLQGLNEIGIRDASPEDVFKMLPIDEMEPAIEIMADVRAYFQVAYKRFADNVPQAVDYELVRGIERNILSVLYSRLGIDGPEGHRICKELAHENHHVAAKRRDLEKKLERLETAMAELLDVESTMATAGCQC